MAGSNRANRSDFNVGLPQHPEVIVDVRISNTSAPSYLHDTPDTVLAAGQNEKIQKYHLPMGDRVYNTHYFVPFIVLTTGNIGPKALE